VVRLTPERLDELEALLAKATPRPWQARESAPYGEVVVIIDGPRGDGEVELTPGNARAIAAVMSVAENLIRGYRAGLAAQHELAAARALLVYLYDLIHAYDAARKGEVDAGAGGGGGGIRDGAAERGGA